MPDGFANAIIGGAEVLIRSAIKSANYVAGVAGWRIAKDGTAELNTATIRGSVVAGGGAVTLDSTGLTIVGPSEIFTILQNNGFSATRNPNDGALARMDVQTNGTGYGGTITLDLTSPSSNGHTFNRGLVYASLSQVGAVDIPHLTLSSPPVTGLSSASIDLQSQNSSGTLDSIVSVTSNQFNVLTNGTAPQVNIDADQINLNANGNVVTNRPRWVADWGTPSIPNNAVTTMTPSVVNVNTGSMGSGSTITVPTIDVWDIGCIIRFATNNTGNRMVRILLNGSELNSFVIPSVAGFNTTAAISIKPLLNAGDQIQFTAYQSSGAALSLTGGGNKAWVMKELA